MWGDVRGVTYTSHFIRGEVVLIKMIIFCWKIQTISKHFIQLEKSKLSHFEEGIFLLTFSITVSSSVLTPSLQRLISAFTSSLLLLLFPSSLPHPGGNSSTVCFQSPLLCASPSAMCIDFLASCLSMIYLHGSGVWWICRERRTGGKSGNTSLFDDLHE